jgi:urease accessory protein
MTATGWLGRVQLSYTADAGRTRAHDTFEGPLRVLQALYPEGPGICHHVLVHPPGGVVGGDVLQIEAHLGPGSHALITTPSATRFYRSGGRPASQSAVLRVASGARLEWLPLEAIAYPGCEADNTVRAELASGAEMMGWDLLALGLPHSKESFASGALAAGGWFRQHLELPGVWLERGRVQAADSALLQSPLAWAGHPVMATMWWAQGQPLGSARRQALLEAARDTLAGHELATTAGVTAPQDQVLVLRVLAERVETALNLLMAVRAAWRHVAWGLAAEPPRVWRS